MEKLSYCKPEVEVIEIISENGMMIITGSGGVSEDLGGLDDADTGSSAYSLNRTFPWSSED